MKLWASSSAVDTDFTAKLVDVWPNGKAYNIVDGIVRARYRESISEAKIMEPGKIYEFTINLGATCNVFKTGHRIRVDISSSNFPKWDRNLNTGNPIGQDAEMKVALQEVHHSQPSGIQGLNRHTRTYTIVTTARSAGTMLSDRRQPRAPNAAASKVFRPTLIFS